VEEKGQQAAEITEVTVAVPGEDATLTLSPAKAYEWATGIAKAADYAEEQETPPKVTVEIPAQQRKFSFSPAQARELSAALIDALGDYDPYSAEVKEAELEGVSGGQGEGSGGAFMKISPGPQASVNYPPN
jgi:hypothetical protein